MGSDSITLVTNTYYKGNNSSSKEFTIPQGNKNPFTILILLTAILLNCFYLSSNEYWLSSFHLISALLFGTVVIFIVSFSVKEETVLLVVPVAMQLKTTYLSGRETITLIPWHLLGNLMILDIIVGQQVLFFLAVQIRINENSSDHIILFRQTKPRLKYLERIYKDFQEILDVNR